jgi:hypothetical protein
LEILVAQRLVVVPPVNIPEACRGVPDLFPIGPEPGNPAKRGADPKHQESLAHLLQGVGGVGDVAPVRHLDGLLRDCIVFGLRVV